jgi:DNA-nicking Smr family endonuclease
MSRRKITDEERKLFAEAFKETRPHKPAKGAAKPAPKLTLQAPQKHTGGLDGNTAERLRKGALDPDARIDLHGMTEAVAHGALLSFLRNARKDGARLVLVITGKGARKPAPDQPFDLELERRARGVLKSMVPRWLGEPSFAELIADHRGAHRRHGGSGAMYVYLRKRRG